MKLTEAQVFQRQEAIERLQNGESQADVARAYNINPAAICRLRRAELGVEWSVYKAGVERMPPQVRAMKAQTPLTPGEVEALILDGELLDRREVKK